MIALAESSTTDAVVRVQGLRRRFGNFWAVDGVDLDVAAGEVVGLLGPNGAGKSTTLRIICGLLVPTAGHVRVAGFDPARQPLAVKRQIGYLTQHFSLYSDLTAQENLLFYGALYGLSGARLTETVGRWLGLVGLESQASRLAGELPPGWTRRLGFACAAIAEPSVLVLDEPTSGVDLETSDLLWGLCGRLAAGGAAVLVSTHSMAEAERCGRVCIMSAGRVVGEGTPQALVDTLQGHMLGIEAEPLGAAVGALKAWPAARAVAVVGRWIRVEVAGDATAMLAEARAVVETAGARVLACQALSPSLDDVFVHLVAGSGGTA
ncbi:MAG: ABC transporter ATP-binding protein [Armatimonadetes bacterium]|nr:ABC transporter ATP-binding protein [Armatimonadota bacterium]